MRHRPPSRAAGPVRRGARGRGDAAGPVDAVEDQAWPLGDLFRGPVAGVDQQRLDVVLVDDVRLAAGTTGRP